MFPGTNLDTSARRDELLHHLRKSSENNRVQVHFNMRTVDPSNSDNAVNPAWRPMYLFSQQAVRWPPHAPPAEILRLRNEFQQGDMQRWRDISPGAGSYLAEADRLEPDFGQAFCGEKYPRLLDLKFKLDLNSSLDCYTRLLRRSWHRETT